MNAFDFLYKIKLYEDLKIFYFTPYYLTSVNMIIRVYYNDAQFIYLFLSKKYYLIKKTLCRT